MTAPRTIPSTVRGLAMACHLPPTVAVTALTTALAVAVGNVPLIVVSVALTILTGQMSIGWSNDWIDAGRDRAVGRSDKPVATGAVTAGQVRAAALSALVLSVPLSVPLGWRALLLHLVAVLSGWTYNFVAKRTVWSWLPYAVSFGSLPNIVTLALPAHPLAPGWATGAGALLGFGAHLTNVLPDLEDDSATGVRGFPHRLGRTRAALLAPIALFGATLLVVLGPAGSPSVFAWTGLATATGCAVASALVAVRSPRSRLPFLLTIVLAVIDVVLLIASGSQLA